MLELGSIAAIIGASVALTGAVGGLLMKAFITPVRARTDSNNELLKDHETRLRNAEVKVNTHSVHMETLLKAVDQLVVKIDLLVTNRYTRAQDQEQK